MNYESVILTGATGFLGIRLGSELGRRGVTVIPLGRPDRIKYAVRPGMAVIHLAAQTEVGRAKEYPWETWQGNVLGTLGVLEECRLGGAKRVIIASTDKVYGEGGGEPYREDMTLRAGGVYETSKAMADLAAQCYAKTYGLSVAITRCANLYGPGQFNPTALIPSVMKDVLEGKRPVLRSDGSAIRDWLYVDDAVDGYLRLLERPDAVGPFNFGTGAGTSVLDVTREILKAAGSDLTPDIRGTARGEISSQIVGYLRAAEELGWAPEGNLRSGLRVTLNWFREFLGRVA